MILALAGAAKNIKSAACNMRVYDSYHLTNNREGIGEPNSERAARLGEAACDSPSGSNETKILQKRCGICKKSKN